jgi:hypothetical protein
LSPKFQLHSIIGVEASQATERAVLPILLAISRKTFLWLFRGQ